MVKYVKSEYMLMKIKKSISNSKNKKILLGLILAIVTIVIYLAVAANAKFFPFNSQQRSFEQGEYIVNLDKTDTEKEAIKNLEENPGVKTENNQTDTPATPPTDAASGKQTVNVLLTNVGINDGNVSASGFVTNLSENGGSCEYVFTNGTQSISKPVETVANSTSTTCKTASFGSEELPSKGRWSVQLKYASSAAQGSSNQKEFMY